MDHEQVEDVDLLTVIVLVAGLVVGVFSQLGLLSTEIIFGLVTGKTVWPDWIILERDLGDKWLL